MVTIRNYTNTKCELEIATARLNLLIDKKISIYNKYFPLVPKLKDMIVDGGIENTDKMIDYIHEIEEIDIGTGMSIASEITYQQKIIEKLQNYIDIMNVTLSKMTGIEYQLFYEIVYNGTSVTRAVEIIANTNRKDNSTIWKNYYSRIKKDIKKLNKFQNI